MVVVTSRRVAASWWGPCGWSCGCGVVVVSLSCAHVVVVSWWHRRHVGVFVLGRLGNKGGGAHLVMVVVLSCRLW
jgi:hypothetical protein